MNTTKQPEKQTYRVVDSKGRVVARGIESMRTAQSVIPPSAADEYKVVPEDDSDRIDN